jgi:eukaryotic-like serine/threonine-protein kinase
VLRDQGDLAGALQAFRADLAIAERLAADDPSQAGWQRDMIVSYAKLGGMDPGAGWWAKALAVAEEMAAKEILTPRDAWMLEDLKSRAAKDAER